MDATEVCSTYIESFRERDFSAMENLLSDSFRFRALIPGYNDTGELRTSETGKGMMRYLSAWFGEADSFEFLKSEAYRLGSRHHIWYRIRFHDSDGWQVCEQRAFCDIDSGKITGMDLLCSGFLREE